MRYRWIEPHGKGWRAAVMVRGKRRKGPARPTRAEAYEDALALRGEMARGPGRITLGSAMELTLRVSAAKANRKGTERFYRAHFRVIGKTLSREVTLEDVTTRDVLGFIEKRMAAGVSANGISADLRVLKRVFNVARKHGGYRGQNPVTLVEPPRSQDPPRRHLDWQTALGIIQLVRQQDPWAADVFELCLRSGLRRSEMARLEVADCQSDRIVLRDGVQKSPGGGVVLVTDAWRAVIERIAGLQRKFVIPGDSEDRRVSWIARLFSAWRKRLGVEVWNAHALRHTLGHALGERHNLFVVRDALRHAAKSAKVTSSYVKGKDSALRDALDGLG